MLRSRWMRVLIGLAGAVGLVLIAWNWWLYPTYTIRYRLTVEVQVGDQVRSGSSVIESIREEKPRILPEAGGAFFRVRGEAVVVDLGDGRNLVVTLTDDASGRADAPDELGPLDAARLPVAIFGVRFDNFADSMLKAEAMGRVEVPSGRLPTTVTFRTPRDPTSIEIVVPSESQRAFGPDVQRVRAFIELTDDPLTTGIVNFLPWLPKIEEEGGAIDGTRFPRTNELKSNLGGLAFRQ